MIHGILDINANTFELFYLRLNFMCPIPNRFVRWTRGWSAKGIQRETTTLQPNDLSCFVSNSAEYESTLFPIRIRDTRWAERDVISREKFRIRQVNGIAELPWDLSSSWKLKSFTRRVESFVRNRGSVVSLLFGIEFFSSIEDRNYCKPFKSKFLN